MQLLKSRLLKDFYNQTLIYSKLHVIYCLSTKNLKLYKSNEERDFRLI